MKGSLIRNVERAGNGEGREKRLKKKENGIMRTRGEKYDGAIKNKSGKRAISQSRPGQRRDKGRRDFQQANFDVGGLAGRTTRCRRVETPDDGVKVRNG